MIKDFIKRRWQSIVIALLLITLFCGVPGAAIADTIKIQALPSLNDLSDVNATSPSDSDVLTWNATSGQWVNAVGGSLNLTDLQDAVADLQADVGILQGDFSALNTTVSGHTVDIGSLQGNVSDIQDDILDIQGDISILQDCCSALNITVDGLITDVGILQGDVSSLQGAVSAIQGDISTLQGIVSDIQADISDLQNDVSDLQGDVSALEGRMDEAEGNISANSGNITGLKNIAIIYVIDGGGSVVTTGQKGHLDIPFDCTITGWTLLADQSGSIVIDVWSDTYANFPPTVADTIAGSEKPTLSTAQKNQDLDLGTWTTSVSAGDILAFNVDSCSNITRVTLTITVVRVI